MVSDGIKAAQSQARNSPLISSTWTPSTFPAASILSAIKQAAIRVNPPRVSRRQPGRHAAPGRALLSRNASRLPAPSLS
jgi:hypothetical protein